MLETLAEKAADNTALNWFKQASTLAKLNGESNFWFDTASGVLPSASEAIHEEFQSGQALGALGQGAAIGIGLSWMVNCSRPAPVRLIGTLINSAMALRLTWDTGQTVGKIWQLKDQSINSGKYHESVNEARKIAGGYLADGTIGMLGGHLGFVGEHGANLLINKWSNKPRLAVCGADISNASIGDRPHSTAPELPHFNAMSASSEGSKSPLGSTQNHIDSTRTCTARPEIESPIPTAPDKSDTSGEIDSTEVHPDQEGLTNKLLWRTSDYYPHNHLVSAPSLNDYGRFGQSLCIWKGEWFRKHPLGLSDLDAMAQTYKDVFSLEQIRGFLGELDSHGIQYKHGDKLLIMSPDENVQKELGFKLRRHRAFGWGNFSEPTPFEVLWTDSKTLKDILETPDPEQVDLDWCIQRFSEDFSGFWQTRETAFGKCDSVSDRFFKFLKQKGVVSPEQIKSGEAEVHIDWDWLPGSGHAYVRIGPKVIDWTARQFSYDGPVPRIFEEEYPGEYYAKSKGWSREEYLRLMQRQKDQEDQLNS